MQGINDFTGAFQNTVMEVLDHTPHYQKSRIVQAVTRHAEDVAKRAWLCGRDKMLGVLEAAQKTQQANGYTPQHLLLIIDRNAEGGHLVMDAISGQPIFDLKP